ncbi:MAG TPA: dual specificity protein phosphatase family protein [Bacteroidia bacterium]
MSKAILITQCLQNDFVQPIGLHDKLPNALHIGYDEAKRLMGEHPREGILMQLMQWAYGQSEEELKLINIRDWHDASDPAQKMHLEQFGLHCLKDTEGAKFVFEEVRKPEKDVIINASGLNDFVDTNLAQELDKYKGQRIRVGIIGVWTEAKVTYLVYELATRYPDFEIGICNALTASSSTHMHYVSLEQLKKVLGVQLFASVTEFANFLSEDKNQLNPVSAKKEYGLQVTFDSSYEMQEEDRGLLNYLFRNSRSGEFKVLDGGFSGNVVLKAKSKDVHGHEEVATVVKIGARNPIAKERESFERIRDILGNNAPSVVDYAESENRAGIKYRYASMFDEKVTTFQNYYAVEKNVEKLCSFLDVVFKKQLGRFYKAATLEKLDLIRYYDFSEKYMSSVKKLTEALIGELNPVETTMQVEGKTCYNLVRFYAHDLNRFEGRSVHSHYMAYLHGDLNGANIIIDAQENVWLIDFFHTHRGHVLKDLIKFENDLTYIFTKINSKTELEEGMEFIDHILNVDDLWEQLPERKFRNGQFNKALAIINYLRSNYMDLIQTDRSPHQLFVGLLRYSVHTLSFDECNEWQRKLALYASGVLAEKIVNHIDSSNSLRIDFIKGMDAFIGMTILPGRKDRGRNLDEDIAKIRQEGIEKVVCLIATEEFERYGVNDLLSSYRENGIDAKHLNIVDQGIPTKEEMKNITAWINDQQKENKKVLIHCVGGLGRTGTVAACYLKEYFKLSTEEAIKKIREVRSSRAVESEMQEKFVEAYN